MSITHTHIWYNISLWRFPNIEASQYHILYIYIQISLLGMPCYWGCPPSGARVVRADGDIGEDGWLACCKVFRYWDTFSKQKVDWDVQGSFLQLCNNGVKAPTSWDMAPPMRASLQIITHSFLEISYCHTITKGYKRVIYRKKSLA